jgi:hypothetical protein
MIVVNFSTKQYAAGQNRLATSLLKADCKTLMMFDYREIGSPTHQQSPYEFKIHAIEKAFDIDDIVLWVDSSMWLVGDLGKVERIIQRDGYFMEEAGHYVDRWCNDHTRKYFNLSSPNGFTMFSAGLLGLNLKNETAMEFFYKWKQSALAGCFRGDWKDHRHDMTCGSIIACRMGLKYQTGGTHMAYIGEGYEQPKEGVVFYAQGL